MPRTTKEAPVKKAAAKVAKTAKVKKINLKIQKPASLPEEYKINSGATVNDLSVELNLSGYVFTVNGKEVNNGYAFENDDLVRIGVKTKQG